jgi:hypothetical protein
LPLGENAALTPKPPKMENWELKKLLQWFAVCYQRSHDGFRV